MTPHGGGASSTRQWPLVVPRQAGHQCAGDGHPDLMRLLTSRGPLSVALTPPPVGFPTDRLDGYGQRFQPQLERTTHLGRIAGGPGAFEQRPTGMGMARFGEAALRPPLPTGRVRRDHPPITHAWSGVFAPGEVSQVRHEGDGRGALHPPEGLQGFHHREPPPGVRLRWPRLCEPLQAFSGFGDRPHGCLEDDVVRGCGTDAFGEPMPRRRAPGRSAGIPAIRPPEKGVEPHLCGVESPDSLFTRAAQLTQGFILDRGDRDGGEIAGAPQAGPLSSVTAVGVDAVARLLREERRCHHPTAMAFRGQIAVEPIATGTRLLNKDEGWSRGLPLADQLLDGTLARADGAQQDHVGPVIWGHVGDRDGRVGDIHADLKGGRWGLADL
jgi:hypothetical protein